MWHLLVWVGRHPQAPVTVAAKPHYFCELNVPATIDNLLEHCPGFWTSPEFEKCVTSGDVLALDPEHFLNVLLSLLHKSGRARDRARRHARAFLDSLPWDHACRTLLHAMDEAQLLQFDAQLSQSHHRRPHEWAVALRSPPDESTPGNDTRPSAAEEPAAVAAAAGEAAPHNARPPALSVQGASAERTLASGGIGGGDGQKVLGAKRSWPRSAMPAIGSSEARREAPALPVGWRGMAWPSLQDLLLVHALAGKHLQLGQLLRESAAAEFGQIRALSRCVHADGIADACAAVAGNHQPGGSQQIDAIRDKIRVMIQGAGQVDEPLPTGADRPAVTRHDHRAFLLSLQGKLETPAAWIGFLLEVWTLSLALEELASGDPESLAALLHSRGYACQWQASSGPGFCVPSPSIPDAARTTAEVERPGHSLDAGQVRAPTLPSSDDRSLRPFGSAAGQYELLDSDDEHSQRKSRHKLRKKKHKKKKRSATSSVYSVATCLPLALYHQCSSNALFPTCLSNTMLQHTS